MEFPEVWTDSNLKTFCVMTLWRGLCGKGGYFLEQYIVTNGKCPTESLKEESKF